MANKLKQSTSRVVRLGPFVDATDGVTPETGITLGAADQAEALKAAGAATVDISSNTFAAVTGCDGWYDLTLTTTDTNTLGDLTIVIQDSSVCLPVFKTFEVVPANIYDSEVAGTDTLNAAVTEWNGVALATTNPLPNAAADAAGGLPISDAGGLDMDAILADTNELQTDWVNGGRLDLIIDAILTDTGTTLPATLAALNDLSAAEVNAEVVDALATDTYAESSGVPAATASLAAKIQWLATLARNKITQTGTTQTLRNDADSGNIATAAVSDDGTTTTRAEWS